MDEEQVNDIINRRNVNTNSGITYNENYVFDPLETNMYGYGELDHDDVELDFDITQ